MTKLITEKNMSDKTIIISKISDTAQSVKYSSMSPNSLSATTYPLTFLVIFKFFAVILAQNLENGTIFLFEIDTHSTYIMIRLFY